MPAHPANRLAREKSPYLLQHAHNPVDWFPWGEEALNKARAENKPVFLSIGYATCHWCHVMERESFESESIAARLNRDFVPVKVDREERPDLDGVYMAYVQATTGSGGWPMSVWLTPDGKPFLGGTYFPPDDRHGRPGFASVLDKVAAAWRDRRGELVRSADHALDFLNRLSAPPPDAADDLDAALLDQAARRIKATYEPRHGGFGDAPKFPRPVTLNFLIRHHARTGDPEARTMLLHTLRAMADGGLHDHLGGGFHRYSVDTFWHVPHFEKMLYDQAQLAIAYLEAFQLTGDPALAEPARDTLDYVLRDLTAPDGAFYSAEDADSATAPDAAEKKEGAFYVWTQAELLAALGPVDGARFCFHYGVEPHGNAPDDPHEEFTGQNILIVRHPVEETAARFGGDPGPTAAALARDRETLRALRARRPRPLCDDKVLAAWNGLMLSAFARAAAVLDEPVYRAAALRAAAALEARLIRPDSGDLLRRHRDGEGAIDAFLDDYAFLIQGLLDLYETTGDPHFLHRATDLQGRQDARFLDPEHGGYFSTDGRDPSVLVRARDDYDGAEPSGQAIAALNLIRLAALLDRDDLRDRARHTVTALLPRLRRSPEASPQGLVAAEALLHPPLQIVIAGDAEQETTRAMTRAVHRRFLPRRVLLAAGRDHAPAWLAPYTPRDGQATAYLCEHGTCQAPTTDPAAFSRALDALRPG